MLSNDKSKGFRDCRFVRTFVRVATNNAVEPIAIKINTSFNVVNWLKSMETVFLNDKTIESTISPPAA